MDQNSLEPKKLRNASVTILSEILKVKAKLDEDLVKTHNSILQSFLDTFIPEMKKCDKLFDSLYQTIYFTGSYYSNLRISEPNEYDLNLLLSLPFELQNVSVEYESQVPSYVKYRLKDETNVTREDVMDTLFENGFLSPDKVRPWFQSVVDKAMETYRRPRRLAQVRCSSSGPARTIILVKKDGTQIDIDLVPVIECSTNLKPPGIDSRVYEKFSGKLQGQKSVCKKARDKVKRPAGQPMTEGTSSQMCNNVPRKQRVRTKPKRPAGDASNQRRNTAPRKHTRHQFPVTCFIVPKPYKPSEQAPVDDTECARLWRAHYPKAEEVVIHDLGCVKPLIKLLKLLRDKEDWKILASYYLKTVVMWMIIENPSEESWKMDHLGEKFVEALEKLQGYVERREIPYFFNSSYNLLEKLSEEQASNIRNRLLTLIRDIESDNEKLWWVFYCPRG